MPGKTLSGSCACGATTYTSSAGPEQFNLCYCRTCQTTSGGPFIGWLAIAKAAIQWSGNPRSENRGGDLAVRTFCKSCGSTLSKEYFLEPQRSHVSVSSVSYSSFPLPQIGAHTFVKDKPSWYAIGTPGRQYPEFEPAFEKSINDFLVL